MPSSGHLAPVMLEEWSRTKRAPRHADMASRGARKALKIDHTHDPDASSWVPGANEHADFPVQNIPLGVFSDENGESRIGCAIGDWVLDLKALSDGNLFPDPVVQALRSDTLNILFQLPQSTRQKLRETLFDLLTNDKDVTSLRPHLKANGDCEMRLPFRVGDFTDFYVGIHHATNAGKLFRPDNPLITELQVCSDRLS